MKGGQSPEDFRAAPAGKTKNPNGKRLQATCTWYLAFIRWKNA
jgi:hypothetical protein